jgi:hydrogenase/urease accessory protein HupE
MTFLRIAFLALAGVLASPGVRAHEVRPAYLEMRETAPEEYAILWKTPALGDMRLGLYLQLPENCKTKGEPVAAIVGGAYSERWLTKCTGGLGGHQISVDGLRTSLTDVLARVSFAGGGVQVARLTPENPAFRIIGGHSGFQVAWTYFMLGVEHILAGVDHLLFVLALILLIHDRRILITTITAFTVAHSVTLVGSSLGYISLPQKPVEATIALSIAFVASELVKSREGQLRMSERAPWLVAFAFGLLHGFGFAGALQEIGLPQTDVSLALLMFNVGVEAGQLIFVAGVLLVCACAARLTSITAAPVRLAAGYIIGVASMFWLIERLVSVTGA